MKIACQYAIVRFMPFIETGEFANVGILMMAPKARFFGFKLLTRRHGRITRFFDELDATVFRSAMYDLKGELTRVNDVLKTHGFDRRYKVNDVEFANGLFGEVVRTRETIIQFGETRAVLADDPKAKLKDLYAFYVERDFVTKQYREFLLDKGIRKLLFNAHVGDRFARADIGDAEYRVTFPFVEMTAEQPKKIIKPLNLTQEDTSKILEHGGKWEFRVRELKKRHALPARVLFAVEGPKNDGALGNAYREVLDMLQGTGVDIVPIEEREQILDFALAG